MPALVSLKVRSLDVEWDTACLTDVPRVAQFAGRARQLLPALVDVEMVDVGNLGVVRRGAQAECLRQVAPALRGLGVR